MSKSCKNGVLFESDNKRACNTGIMKKKSYFGKVSKDGGRNKKIKKKHP